MTATPIIAPHMTPIERDLYEAGHREDYRGFTIVPKRDFGSSGYWSAEHRCNINAGWVVIYGAGKFAGCNAAPGATFAWTLAGARDMIDDLISAGISSRCDQVEDGTGAQRFWVINRARHAAKPVEVVADDVADDEGYPGPCTDPGGHEWPRDIEENERCLCIHCGADGDA